MDEGDGTIKSNFAKQRRNLILISMVLSIYLTMGLELQCLNLFGNVIVLRDPSTIGWWLWFIWLYFLVRFYQIFRIVSDKGFSSIYNQSMPKFVGQSAFRNFVRESKKNGAFDSNEFGHKYCPETQDVDVFSAHPWRWELKLQGRIEYETKSGTKGARNLGGVGSALIGKQLTSSKNPGFCSCVSEYTISNGIRISVFDRSVSPLLLDIF